MNRLAKYCSILLFLSIFMTPILGCKNKDKDNSREDEQAFVAECVAISLAYLDSIENAGDSLTVDSLFVRYDHNLNRLNYKYPPDLYLKLSEGENDTITRITLRIITARDSLLYLFAHRPIQTDTIVNDSNNDIEEVTLLVES